MNNYQKEKLYKVIDADEEMSDSEKREVYFSEIAEQEDQEEYERRNKKAKRGGQVSMLHSIFRIFLIVVFWLKE